MNHGRRVHVAVGVVTGADGRVLISRRPEGVHQGGLWEFPGGKVEAGETVGDALARELREELGIDVIAERALLRVPFRYPDKTVLLDVWTARHVAGAPRAREVADWRWVWPTELPAYAFPAANRAILQAVMLPERYAITPPAGEPAPLLEGLEATLLAGVRLVQWRHAASDDAVLDRACRLCHAWGARLLLNGSPERAAALGLDGVHLSMPRLRAAAERPLPVDGLVGASCHGPAELALALERDVDFAVLSPLAPTPSHPGRAPLGWERFAAWVADYPRPVYALGGVGEGDLPRARAARAQGVAAIRGLWRSAR